MRKITREGRDARENREYRGGLRQGYLRRSRWDGCDDYLEHGRDETAGTPRREPPILAHVGLASPDESSSFCKLCSSVSRPSRASATRGGGGSPSRCPPRTSCLATSSAGISLSRGFSFSPSLRALRI